jgi:methyl-accepting chemotaxis protein
MARFCSWVHEAIGMKLRTKIVAGFSSVLVLMAISSGWGINALSGLLDDTSEVVTADHLRTNLVMREVDHLKFASSLASFVFDQRIHELNVQLDPKQCALGKWYYSEERRLTEQRFPDLAGPLKEIEAAHNRLHA